MQVLTKAPNQEKSASKPLTSQALIATMNEFKEVSGVALAREIFLLENENAENPIQSEKDKTRREHSIQSQISRHCSKGQPVMSTFLEYLLAALERIEPKAKAFYLEKLGAKSEKSSGDIEEPTRTADSKDLVNATLALINHGDPQTLKVLIDAFAERVKNILLNPLNNGKENEE